MGVILTPKRFLSKPQYEVQIDYGNPICQGLVGAFNILNIGARNLVTKNLSTLTGSPTYSPSTGATFNGSTQDIRESYGASQPASYMDNVSCMAVFTPTTAPAAFGAAAGLTILTSQRGTIEVGINSSGYGSMQFTTSTNFFVQAGAAVSLVGKESVVIATRDSAAAPTNVKIYQGGMGRTFNGTVGTGTPLYGNGGTINYLHGQGANTAFFNGSVKISAVWNRLLSDAELQSLSDNPYQIFKAPSKRVFFGAASPDRTVALTGQSIASATGTLKATTDKALTGQSISAAQGTAAPTTAKALTGQSIATAQGAALPNTDKALTGQSIATAQGTVSVGSDVTVSISGQSIASALGTVALANSLPLTGQSIATSLGAATPNTDKAATGQSISTAQGSVTTDATVGLSGQSISTALGTVGIPGDVTVSITGLSISAYLGALVAAVPSESQPGMWWYGENLRKDKRKKLDKDELEEIKQEIVEILEVPIEQSTVEVKKKALKNSVNAISSLARNINLFKKSDQSAVEKFISNLEAKQTRLKAAIQQQEEDDEEDSILLLLN